MVYIEQKTIYKGEVGLRSIATEQYIKRGETVKITYIGEDDEYKGQTMTLTTTTQLENPYRKGEMRESQYGTADYCLEYHKWKNDTSNVKSNQD
jgi:hypothetical protein